MIEMLISLVIVMIVSLALIQTALLGVRTNVQNSMRDEAVSVAEARMNELRDRRFTETVTHSDLNPGTTVLNDVPRNLRGAIINYKPTQTIVDINTNTKQLNVKVEWTYRGKQYNHDVTSIMRREK